MIKDDAAARLFMHEGYRLRRTTTPPARRTPKREILRLGPETGDLELLQALSESHDFIPLRLEDSGTRGSGPWTSRHRAGVMDSGNNRDNQAADERALSTRLIGPSGGVRETRSPPNGGK